VKPDLVAPATRCGRRSSRQHVAATAPDGTIDGKLIAMSGSSVSAGVVSGVAALMLEANPRFGRPREDGASALGAVLPEGVLVAARGA